MPIAGDLQPAAGYDDRWLALALGAVALVAAYYLAVWWWTRPRAARPAVRAPDRATRERCLAELSRIEQAVATGAVSSRVAHQDLSRVVREYVAATSGVPAATMTLGALRDRGPAPLADLVAVLYPPEFGPGEDHARDDLARSVDEARRLVTAWR